MPEIDENRAKTLQTILKTIPQEELLYDLAELFKIFGDSSRIRILSLLQVDKLCVGEISHLLNLSPSAVSHQLRILRQARLVRYQKIGKEVFYSLDDDHIEKIFNQGLEHIQENVRKKMNCYNNQCETIYAKSKEKFLHQTFFIGAILLYCVALLVDLEILRFHLNPLILTFLFVFCYFTLGFGILKEAFRSLIKREYFNENTLMALASLSAFGIGESAEAVAILIFYRIGESLQERVVEKAKTQIRSLSALKIESARILRENTQISISPQEIQAGDRLIVFAGERIPADGKIVQGESNLDNSALNGESIPQNVKVGDMVFSGGINLDGILHIQATQNYANSTFSKILQLIEEGNAQKVAARNLSQNLLAIIRSLLRS